MHKDVNDVNITPEERRSIWQLWRQNLKDWAWYIRENPDWLDLDIQTAADAYITAWLRWQLDDDIYAKRVFTGKDPEILRNPAWDNAEVRNPETTQPKQTEK